MRNYLNLFFPIFSLFALISTTVTAQSFGKQETWSKSELIQPSELMVLLNNAKAKKPPVFNIGFVNDISGSKNLGAARDKAGLVNLEDAVKNLSKNDLVVIYCGCCPFEHCPNVRPAYTLLKKLGFTKGKILNLPTSLKADWIDKGYPLTTL